MNENRNYRPLSNAAELHVEISDSCNLQCGYCYFVSKKRVRTPFPMELFNRVIEAYFEQINSDVTLVFHGGEPLLVGADWIDEACEIAKMQAAKNGHRICFHLQTNGTLLNDKIIEVLVRQGFSVNVSLDGPKTIHNAARGGYTKTVQAIKKLQEANILAGVITVIGKHNYNRIPEVVHEIVSLGVTRYHFNIGSILTGETELILNKDEIYSYLVDAYSMFVSTYRSACNWVLLGKLRRFVSGVIPEFACDSPICGAAIHKIHLKQNGAFYPCGSCVSTQDADHLFCLGNIEAPVIQERFEQQLAQFHHLYFEHRETCMECPGQLICDFFCPAFDELDPKTIQNKCESYRKFNAFLLKRDPSEIRSIVDYYNNAE